MSPRGLNLPAARPPTPGTAIAVGRRMENNPSVGFAGLGAMGSRMARRIRQGGYPLAVWNRSPAATEPFKADGVPVAASPAELAGRSDTVVSMLFDDAAVRDTIGQVIAAGRAGLTIVEMSTVSPDTARELHAAAAARGIGFVNAPVSGSTPQAEAGQLVVLVGAEADVFERVKPLLLTMGKSAEHFGGPGAGSVVKLAINAMLCVGVQALAEGLALAERGGVDRKQFLDAIGQTAVVSPGQKAKFPNAERNEYPPAFALRTAAKDLGLIAALAEQLGLALPATAAVRAAMDAAVDRFGKEDFSVVVRTAQDRTA